MVFYTPVKSLFTSIKAVILVIGGGNQSAQKTLTFSQQIDRTSLGYNRLGFKPQAVKGCVICKCRLQASQLGFIIVVPGT